MLSHKTKNGPLGANSSFARVSSLAHEHGSNRLLVIDLFVGPDLVRAKNIWAVKSSELTLPGLALGVPRPAPGDGQIPRPLTDQADQLFAVVLFDAPMPFP